MQIAQKTRAGAKLAQPRFDVRCRLTVDTAANGGQCQREAGRFVQAVVAEICPASNDNGILATVLKCQERECRRRHVRTEILTEQTIKIGKLSSSHDYPLRGRGGQGVAAMDRAMRAGPLVALFAVATDDQIMLATDAGQSIRVPVDDISFRSRGAGGVRVFNTARDERVVSVALIAENGEEEDA